MEIPTRPRPAPAGQQRAVGMQHRLVLLVRDSTEDVVLAVGGVGEYPQRLVRVHGEYDFVEFFGLGPVGLEHDAVVEAAYLAYGRVESHSVAERPHDLAHVTV